MFPTADAGHHESMRRAVLPLDPTVPSNISAIPRTGDRAGANDKVARPGPGHRARPRAEPRAWPEGKVFAEIEAGIHARTVDEVLAETGIMTGTGTWAELRAELSPVDGEVDDLPSMPKDPAAWMGQQRLQAHEESQREQATISSVPTILAERAELQAPALKKPLGLLSKAAWTTKSSSSSSSKASSSSSSSSTTKASSLPSSSSSSSSLASKRDSQTARSDNVSLNVVNSNSSNSNSSSSLGMVPGCSLSFKHISALTFHIVINHSVNPSPKHQSQLSNHNYAQQACQALISPHAETMCMWLSLELYSKLKEFEGPCLFLSLSKPQKTRAKVFSILSFPAN